MNDGLDDWVDGPSMWVAEWDDAIDSARPMVCTRPAYYDGLGWGVMCIDCRGAGSFTVAGEPHLREPCFSCDDGWRRLGWRAVRRARRARRRELRRLARRTR